MISDRPPLSFADSDSGQKKKKKKNKKGPTSPPLVPGMTQAPPPPAISNDYEIKVRNFLSDMAQNRRAGGLPRNAGDGNE